MIFHRVKKILAIKLRHIGDVLLIVPTLRALRENFPDAHLSVLVNSGTEQVLAGNPLINEIIVFNRSIKSMSLLRKYKSEISFLRSVREKVFDMTVDLTGGDRAAILSLISGARYRLGWKSREGLIGKRHLYTHCFKPDSKRHMVLQNLDVISRFGIGTKNLAVDLHIPEDARTFVKRIFEENNIPLHSPLSRGGQGGSKVVHVHPTSRWLFKCWRDEYMADVISWLVGQDMNVVVTSSPDKKEMDKAKRILSLVSEFTPLNIPPLPRGGIGAVIDLCGKTSIKQLAAISETSYLFFGVDSAPMHIAAAIGTPVVALFGPSKPFHWGPWDENNPYGYDKRSGIQKVGKHTVIQKHWDCIPCGKDRCNGAGIIRCMEDIDTEEVKNVLSEKLNRITENGV
jgi:heptosyltransferase-3